MQVLMTYDGPPVKLKLSITGPAPTGVVPIWSVSPPAGLVTLDPAPDGMSCTVTPFPGVPGGGSIRVIVPQSVTARRLTATIGLIVQVPGGDLAIVPA
jgi:hypothetical protein